jgi:hypothetical protein
MTLLYRARKSRLRTLTRASESIKGSWPSLLAAYSSRLYRFANLTYRNGLIEYRRLIVSSSRLNITWAGIWHPCNTRLLYGKRAIDHCGRLFVLGFCSQSRVYARSLGLYLFSN